MKETQNGPIFYGVGSILHLAMRDKRSLFTWGSGLIEAPNASQLEALVTSDKESSNQHYFSVRGPETQIAMLALRGTFARISKDPGQAFLPLSIKYFLEMKKIIAEKIHSQFFTIFRKHIITSNYILMQLHLFFFQSKRSQF